MLITLVHEDTVEGRGKASPTHTPTTPHPPANRVEKRRKRSTKESEITEAEGRQSTLLRMAAPKHPPSLVKANVPA